MLLIAGVIDFPTFADKCEDQSQRRFAIQGDAARTFETDFGKGDAGMRRGTSDTQIR